MFTKENEFSDILPYNLLKKLLILVVQILFFRCYFSHENQYKMKNKKMLLSETYTFFIIDDFMNGKI